MTNNTIVFAICILMAITLYGILMPAINRFRRGSLSIVAGIIGGIAISYFGFSQYMQNEQQAQLWSDYMSLNNCKMIEFGPQSRIMLVKGQWVIDPRGKTIWDCAGVRIEVSK